MARYGPEHKVATRSRMIETAARRFKTDGIDGSGIATLVADAGLTNGAFYGHFSSKEELVASVVALQLQEQAARLEGLPPGISSVDSFVRGYLSAAHRDDLPGGCASAALLDEIGRASVAVREVYTHGVLRLIAAMARLLDGGDSHRAQERAAALFALLVGALQASRAVTDPDLSNQILGTAYDHAMSIATAPPAVCAPNPKELP